MNSLLMLLFATGAGTPQDDWDPALTDETQAWNFARAMVSMGDLNGDGAGDFLVSSTRECPGRDFPGWPAISATPAPGEARPDFGVVRAISGASGAALYGVSRPGGLGRSLACLGDVDEDGKNDFAVGLSNSAVPYGYHVFSGATGKELYSKTDQLDADGGDCLVASVADVSGDGVRDLVVGRPNRIQLHGDTRLPSYVEVVSGVEGRTLLRIDSSQFEKNHASSNAHVLGRQVWGLPDLNGDGKGEVAFTVHVGLDWGSPAEIRVVSGADGEDVFVLERGHALEEHEPKLALVGDLDQDGLSDWAVGSAASSFRFLFDGDELGPQGFAEDWYQPRGLTSVYSSKTRKPILQLQAEHRSPRFGHVTAGGADFDADGIPDLVVTDYGGDCTFKGWCHVFSGADGSLIRTHEGDNGCQDYGASLIVVEDLDWDDCPDYVVGCMDDFPGSFGMGYAIVYSGKTGAELRRIGRP